MSDIPSNWKWSTIGEVSAYIQRGKSPKYIAQSDLPVINQKCIRWEELQLQHLKYIHPEQFPAWDESRFIKPSDILWNSTGTGTVGRAYHVKEADCTPPKVVDSHVTIVRPAPELDARYLFSWIKGPAVQSKIDEMCDGTTNQIELNRAAIAATVIPIPPRDEQTRIANQLDILLTRIQSCNDRFDAIPALLKRFRQAVLDAAVSGELTTDWRETKRAQSWPTVSIGSMTVNSYYGPRFGKDEYTELSTGVPTIRTTDMDRIGRIHISADTPRVLVPAAKIEQYRVKPGDLLVTRTGSIGVMAVFDGNYLAIPSAYLIRFRFNDDLRTRFAYYRLAAPIGQSELGLSTTAVTQPNVNAEAIKRIEFGLPTVEEQDEIIRRVEAFFSLTDRIETRCTAARTQVQRLTPLVLAKAFRGELVQQDPQDEPAKVLLQRIAVAKPPKVVASRGRPRLGKTQRLLPQPIVMHADWAALPNGAWAAPSDFDEHATAALLVAVLRAWDQPILQAEARLTAVLCQQPRLLTAALPAHQTAHWRRLVGSGADPLPERVAIFQPAINSRWRKALAGMRARGDLVESGTGPQGTWALGAGTEHIETTGWPEGRAGWVVAYLRAHGVDAILPLLESEARDFVHARAA